MTDRLQIEYLPLDQLQPADRNPKLHRTGGIRSSIERFGFVDPIEIDERTGRLVAGHGRLEALTAMRDEGAHPPERVLTDTDGQWLVPVVRGWGSRSDTDAEAYLLASNQLTIAGGWNAEQLAPMMRELGETDPTLYETVGFTEDEVAGLLQAGEEINDDGSDDDLTGGDGQMLGIAADGMVAEPDHVVSSGQVWRLGSRRILAVACPHTDWQMWVSYLTGDAVLLPYPSPHAGLAETRGDGPVVLVQPNTYLAGWLVTTWVRGTGGTPQLIAGDPT